VAAARLLLPDRGLDHTERLQRAIDQAAKSGLPVRLGPGRFRAKDLRISAPLTIEGIIGQTIVQSSDGGTILRIEGAKNVTLRGIRFEGAEAPAGGEVPGEALVRAAEAEKIGVERCAFAGGSGSGLSLSKCSGRITACEFADCPETGLFAIDSQGLAITDNHAHDIGNNGIQVWTSDKAEDGTIVSGNRVERIAAKGGGSGQNGNGINIYRAGNVIVASNRVSDCAYSGVRNNSGANCQITGNSISRTGEVAIYVEFAFEGAVVSGNMIEDVGFGISVTNFNEGGRLAVVANNVVRDCKGGTTEGVKAGGGIHAEADTNITGNTIENARDVGISLGWGRYCRDLAATGNVIRDCGKGITVSLSPGAQPVLIASNVISGAKIAAIMGMDQLVPATDDLGKEGVEAPAQIRLSGNLIR
jgi:uncharacterized secreted repeat protein (TIGR03808 family)